MERNATTEYSKMKTEICEFISDTPDLLSLLYDLDMLPEQLKQDSQDYFRMMRIAAGFKDFENRIKKNIKKDYNNGKRILDDVTVDNDNEDYD